MSEKMQKIAEQAKKLQADEVMFMSARKTEGGERPKWSIEVAQNIVLPSTNLIGLLNADDERFSQGSVQRAYPTVELNNFCALFGIDKSVFDESNLVEWSKQNGEVINVIPLGIMNPKLTTGRRASLQIVERLGLKTKWENDNPEQAIKFNPNEENGGYLFKDGQPIVRNFNLVAGNPSEIKHTLIQHDETRSSLYEDVDVAEEDSVLV